MAAPCGAGPPVCPVETDGADTNWTQRCLRQADRVLLVAEAGGEPGPGNLERALEENGALGPGGSRCHLVLLHEPDADSPSGTAAWLDGRTVAMHHHVRHGRMTDHRRLARHLSGSACGLVLGGGGAMGFAHLGVIRALEEAGVEIDVVGGTSIGAVMGALFARGLDHEGQVRAAVSALVEHGSIVGMTLPLVSVSSARKVSGLLRDEPAFGGMIEDLWRPFFCVSASLGRVEEVVHERGSTWRALASTRSQLSRLVDHPIALYLKPPLGDGARMDFGAGVSLIETAYRHTAAHLEANPWPAQI